MGATVGGATHSQVNASPPTLEFIFDNVAAGEHPVVISDIVGLSERALVTVEAAGPESVELLAWLAEWLVELNSGKVEF